MFVQVIQGRVNDAAGLKEKLDSYQRGAGQDAVGWEGATAGVTEDGEFVAVVRFESEEAARANEQRPEQEAFAREMAGFVEGDPTFIDCREVDLFLGGGSDDAGFVQIMQGRADREKLASQSSALEEGLRQMRPDVLGGLIAWHGDNQFVQAVYFSSEAEAREGESRQLSDEEAAQRDEMLSAFEVERYVDLKEPWLYS